MENAKGVQDFLRWLSTMKGFNITGSIAFKIAGLGLFLDAWNTMKEAIQDIMANGPNFTNVTKLISGFAEALGAAFLLFGNIKMAGAMLVISGLTGIVSAISDMVNNGVNWDNALFLVKNLGLFLSGLGMLTGNTKLAGIGLIISGATLIVDNLKGFLEAIRTGRLVECQHGGGCRWCAHAGRWVYPHSQETGRTERQRKRRSSGKTGT